MNEKKFIVSEGNTTLASEMTLDDALLFIKAYIEKYYMEQLSLSITEGKEISLPNSNRARAFQVEIAGEITNGDVIKALFPQYYQNILSYLDNTRWWYSPYKKESENSK